MKAFANASVLAVLAGLTCVSVAIGQPRAERVRLVDMTPVTLRGVNFHPLERVSISLSLGTTDFRRVVRAGPEGQFVTVFPKLRYDRCHGALALAAVGSRGSRTTWKVVPLECPDSGANA
jgi:hypothetical protein